MSTKFDKNRFNENLEHGYADIASAFKKIAGGKKIQDIERVVLHAIESRSCALFYAQLAGAPASCKLRITLFDGLLDMLRKQLERYSIGVTDEDGNESYRQVMFQLSNYGRA